MQTVYLIKQSENDISSKRGIDWFLNDRWMVTEGYIEGLAHQEPSQYEECIKMLAYFDVIRFETLCSISDLREIYPKLRDYPPEQPGYTPDFEDEI